MRKIYYLLLLSLTQTLNAQFIYNSAFGIGSAGYERIHSIKFDAVGNSYVIGEFTGTIDLDPGAGVVNVTAGSGASIFFQKFNPGGTLLWGKSIQRPSSGWGYSTLDIDIDGAGGAYISGNFLGTVDFDPSTNVFNISSTGNLDIFLAQYNSLGNLVFAEKFDSFNNDHLYKMSTNAAGQIAMAMIVTGGGIDLDPGPGVATYAAGYPCNMFLAKYTSTGAYVWSQYINNTGSTWNGISDMKLDGIGDIYITGVLNAANDFDPGVGVLMLAPVGGSDAFIIKYSGASGALIWGKSIGSMGDDVGTGIAIHPTSSRVYWVSAFHNTVDYDPGAGVANLTSNGMYDIGIACYNSATGAYIWAESIGGTNDDVPRTATIDLCENIYIGGDVASSSIDLDPSTGVANFSTAGATDIFVSKYTSMGCYLNGFVIGGPGSDYNWISNFCVPLNQLFIGGEFVNTVDFDPSASVANLTSIAGSPDGYVARYAQVAVGTSTVAPPINTTPPANLAITSCAMISTVLSAIPGYTPATSACTFSSSSTSTPSLCWYDASVGGTYLGTGLTYSTPLLAPGTSTTFYVGYCPDSTACTGLLISTRTPITVTIISGVPVITITGNLNICAGNSTTLTASGLSSYTWTPSSTLSSGTSSVVVANPTTSTTYTIIGGAGSGCSTSTVITVSVIPIPTITLTTTSNTICAGSSSTLIVNSSSSSLGYTWTPSGTLSSSSSGTVIASPNINTTYSVIISSGSCTNSAVTTITVIPTPTLTVTSATICAGQTTTLSVSGATSYTWSTGSLTNSTSVSPSTTTTYTVIGTNGGACAATSTTSVTVFNYPIISSSTVVDVKCNGQSTGSITINASGVSSYNWLPAIGSTTNVATGLSIGNYTCILSAGPSCSIAATFSVTQPSPLVGTVTSTNTTCGLCNGVSIISASGGVSPYSYSWLPSSATQSIAINLCSGTYTPSITDANGCTSISSTIINPSPVFQASITASNTEIYAGELVTLTGMTGVTYTWSPNTFLSCVNCAVTTANPTNDITYCVEVTSIDGCKDSACVDIIIKCGDVFVPNAFSPNNDGHNDELQIYGNCLTNIVFRVFDRWGEIVFECFDITTKWDGKYKGFAVNAGVFVYQFSAKQKNGEYYTKKGNITVVK